MKCPNCFTINYWSETPPVACGKCGHLFGERQPDERAVLYARIAQFEALFTFLRTQCKILYWPEAKEPGGLTPYPIEHNLAADKDQWDELLAADLRAQLAQLRGPNP